MIRFLLAALVATLAVAAVLFVAVRAAGTPWAVPVAVVAVAVAFLSDWFSERRPGLTSLEREVSAGASQEGDGGMTVPPRPLRSLAAPWIAATTDGPYRFRVCDWARDYSYHATLEAAREALEEASEAQLAFRGRPVPDRRDHRVPAAGDGVTESLFSDADDAALAEIRALAQKTWPPDGVDLYAWRVVVRPMLRTLLSRIDRLAQDDE